MATDDLRNFLQDNLPRSTAGVESIMRALEAAGQRYERYAAAREHWETYRNRRVVLKGMADRAEQLQNLIARLDPISRDDLTSALGAERLEALQGYLSSVAVHADRLASSVQASGRPRDLAIERWVHEVADIFEVNFGRKATATGSAARRFYELLRLSMPESFPRAGSLQPRQLTRVLKLRSARRVPVLSR
jgi:hypothetical protein